MHADPYQLACEMKIFLQRQNGVVSKGGILGFWKLGLVFVNDMGIDEIGWNIEYFTNLVASARNLGT